MRRLGLLLAFAACNPSGLTLEVVIDDPGIEKIELFVGERCSGDCPRGTVPPQLPAMAVDHAFVVPDQVPWTVDATDFSDGVAGFRLESPQDTRLDIVVVLGYDAQDQIRWSSTFHGVHVPDADAEHWRVMLTPTTPVAATPATAGSERIARWQQPSRRLPSCLLLEHWDSSTEPTRELVVPDTDRDCDEIPAAAECAPWIPNADGASPTIAEATCLLTATVGTTTPVCVLGGPECNENGAQRDACVPVAGPHCMSSALCACAGTADVDACVMAKVAEGMNTSSIPYLDCVIQLDSDGSACTDTVFEADAGAYLSSSGSTHCHSMALNDGATPLGAFEHYIDLDDTSKLKIESFSEPCKADVYFSGSAMPGSKHGLVALELDNGNHLVVPLRVQLEASGCVEDSRCDFFRPSSTFDSIWQCADPDVAPRCAPNVDAGCAGPMCNGQCCGAGETCGPSGCSCGTSGSRCTGGDTCQAGPVMQDQCGTTCCGVTQLCP